MQAVIGNYETSGYKEPEMQNQEWLPMKEAAAQLKISYYKLIRMVDRGKLETREDDLDRRVRLVNLEEVRRVFRLK
jgi:hypothetical protein